MTISVIRTVILYLLLMLAIRLMGKRQLGELQPSELVVTLLLSDLAAVPMQDNGLPLASGILPILVLVALEILLSGLMLKLPLFARLVSGSPIPIIRDGQMDETAMRRLRLTVDDLVESLRQQDIFEPEQVQYAIVETNGHITAYCYPRYQTATAGDVGADKPDEGMPVPVITDGQLCDWGLQLCGMSEQQLDRLLKKHRCTRQEVFLLTVTKTGQHYLLTRAQVKGGDV